MRLFVLFLLTSVFTTDLHAQFIRDSIQIEGKFRTFTYQQPKGVGYSLLFALHGSGGNATHMIKPAEKLQAIADVEKVLIVYVDGYKTYWNECRKSASTISNKENINEEAFFSELIDHFHSKFTIDKKKVFSVGLSGGGQMSYKFGMTMPDKFRGVSIVVANVPATDNLDCIESRKPIPVMIINGTADDVNPYNGGEMKAGSLILGNVRSSDESFRYWAALAGYKGEPTHKPMVDEIPSDNITIDQYTFSQKGKPEITLLKVNNGKHEFPKGIDAFLTSWQFFKRQMK